MAYYPNPIADKLGGLGIDASGVTDGQIPIGQSSDHSFGLATLTAGSGISIANSGHAVSISATGGGTSTTGQSGSASITISSGNSTATASVSFSPAFSVTPVVVVCSDTGTVVATAESITTSGFTARITCDVPLPAGTSITATVYWSVGAGAASALTLLASSTVSGSSVASITFSSISASYTHLRLVIIGRGTNASANALIKLQFNSDTGSNYDDELGNANNSASWAGQTDNATTAITCGYMSAANSGTNNASGVELIVMNYSGTTLKKMVAAYGGVKNSDAAGSQYLSLSSGFWRSTSAVNAITIFLSAGNLDVGTVVSLYGMA